MSLPRDGLGPTAPQDEYRRTEDAASQKQVPTRLPDNPECGFQRPRLRERVEDTASAQDSKHQDHACPSELFEEPHTPRAVRGYAASSHERKSVCEDHANRRAEEGRVLWGEEVSCASPYSDRAGKDPQATDERQLV